MRAMMVHTGLNEKLNTAPWLECAANATKLENNLVNPHKEIYTHYKFYGKILDYAKYLKTLGEMGILSVKSNL